MTTKEIEAILAKYYDGNSTLQEEHQLKEFFLRTDIPEHLLEHKPIFGFHQEERDVVTSEAFETVFEEKLRQGKVVSLINRRRKITYALSIAASIVLVAGLIITFQLGMFAPSQPFGTISDPDLAYVKKRVPELNDIEYLPMVDHKMARERALLAYKKGLEKFH